MPGMLHRSEQWWKDQYHHLEHNGYELRPCYHPDWEPSWRRTGKDFFAIEDGQPGMLPAVLDATRRCDGRHVILKKVLPEEGPYELRIAQLFSSPEVARNPRNHCVPLLDVIEIPNTGQKLMVMPFLRPFENPRLQTFGEFVDFFTQVCESLQFMHERNVAHRGCTANNIMFDLSGLYPQGFHPTQGGPVRYNRMQRPRRYFMAPSPLSRHYCLREVLDEPLHGIDNPAPEHQAGILCNPFHTDIYHLGNLVRQEFMRKYDGFEFIQDLVDEMTDIHPTNRPLIEGVVEKFSYISGSLDESKLRSPIMSKHKPCFFIMFLCARQALLTLWRIVAGKAIIYEAL